MNEVKDIRIFLFTNGLRIIAELGKQTDDGYIVRDTYTINSDAEESSKVSINPFRYLTDGVLAFTKKDLLCLPVTPSDAFSKYYQAMVEYDYKSVAKIDTYLEEQAYLMNQRTGSQKALDNLLIAAADHLDAKYLLDLLTLPTPSELVH